MASEVAVEAASRFETTASQIIYAQPNSVNSPHDCELGERQGWSQIYPIPRRDSRPQREETQRAQSRRPRPSRKYWQERISVCKALVENTTRLARAGKGSPQSSRRATSRKGLGRGVDFYFFNGYGVVGACSVVDVCTIFSESWGVNLEWVGSLLSSNLGRIQPPGGTRLTDARIGRGSPHHHASCTCSHSVGPSLNYLS